MLFLFFVLDRAILPARSFLLRQPRIVRVRRLCIGVIPNVLDALDGALLLPFGRFVPGLLRVVANACAIGSIDLVANSCNFRDFLTHIRFLGLPMFLRLVKRAGRDAGLEMPCCAKSRVVTASILRVSRANFFSITKLWGGPKAFYPSDATQLPTPPLHFRHISTHRAASRPKNSALFSSPVCPTRSSRPPRSSAMKSCW